MKKGLLFATALTTGFAAFAAQPTLPAEALEATKLEVAPGVATKSALNVVSPKDVTEATKAVITLPTELFFMGMSPDGYTLNNNLGFTAAYQNITFKSASTGANKVVWTYPDVWGEYVPNVGYGELESDKETLTMSAPLTFANGPYLTAFGPDYIDAIDLSIDKQYPVEILYGAGCSILNTAFSRVFGMTPIARMKVDNGVDEGYYFTRGSVLGYDKTKESVVDQQWSNYITSIAEEEDPTATVSDVRYAGFGNIFPAPASPYLIQNVWVWAYTQFSGAGTLTLKVVTLDENDNPLKEIAQGTCDYTEATAGGSILEFPLKSIDEDGFEIDDPVMISERIAFLICDLDEDPNIVDLKPLWPMGYVYDADERNPFRTEMLNLNQIKYKYNGEDVTDYLWSAWSYYTDDTRSSLMAVTSYTFFTDAIYGYCVESGAKVQADVHKGLSADGEEYEFTFEALFEVTEDEITISDDSWVSYELSEFDSQTGTQTLTIMADPLEGKDGNGSVITINAFAAAPLNIYLGQGTLGVENVGANNSEVVASKYFDLQGRELKAQPENGFVIRKDIKADGTSTVVKTVL